jgi:glycosyltransferase involved in cell wall biosynthesis
MRALGHDPTLVVPEARPDRGLGAAAAELSVEVTEAAVAVASSRGVSQPNALTKRRRGARPDLTIINSASVIGSSRREGGKRVLILREWLQPSSITHRMLAQWHRRRARAVLAISTGVRTQWEMCTTGPPARFTVWDWLDEATMIESRSVTSNDTRQGIVCIGRFNQWKGQELLADAYMSAFSTARTRPPLTFLGSQPGTEFAWRGDAMQARGEAGLWTVLPFARDPLPVLKQASVVVVPSLRPEPFGLVILEALACGCHVIASRGGGPDDLAAEFPQAITLTDRSTEDLGSALLKWWQAGAGPQDEVSQRATRTTLDSKFSPDAALQRWQSVLLSLGYRK